MSRGQPLVVLIGALLIGLLAACEAQPMSITRQPASLQVVAGDPCGPLVEALVDAYEESHPWVTIQTEAFNADVAEERLRGGRAELAFTSWVDTGAPSPLWTTPFAQDTVAVIVHPTTPLENVSLAQLQEIFRGRIQEWDGVVLTPVTREAGSGTRATFETVVMGGYEITLTSVVVPAGPAMIDRVAITGGAIGYVSTLHLDPAATERVRVLPVDGFLPTERSGPEETYPLGQALYIAALDEPTGAAREFAQWVLGPQGQTLIRRSGGR
jgi:phosphate transport system substrate-binding protein